MTNITGEVLKNIFSKPENKEEEIPSDNLLIDHIHNGSKIISESRIKTGRLYSSESGHCSRKSALSSVVSGGGISSPAFPFYVGIGKQVEITILESLAKSKTLIFPNLDFVNPLIDEELAQFDLPDIGLNIGGKLDAVVYTQGKPYIVEIKTAGQNLPTNPALEKPQHVAQARIYSAVLGIDSILLYFSRNVSSDMYGKKLKVREFLFKFDRGQSYKFIYEIALARYYLNANLIPPIPTHIMPSNKDKMCGYCNVFDYCWNKDSFTLGFNVDLEEPSDYEIQIAESAAHIFAGNFLKPEAIKERRRDFIYRLKHVGHPAFKDILR